MKIEDENAVKRLSILCHLPDIKIAQINPWIVGSNDKANFPSKLLMNNGQVSRLCKTFLYKIKKNLTL